jgi:hypothetical protein
MKRAIILGVSLVVCILPVFTDVIGGAGPLSYTSRGYDFIAEFFPPFSTGDSLPHSSCYFYQKLRDEPHFKLLWKDTEYQGPFSAIISMDGDLITVDGQVGRGRKNSIMIYSREGKRSKTLDYDELFPTFVPELDTLYPFNNLWNVDASYYFVNLDKPQSERFPTHLYIRLKWNKAFEFRLSDGVFRYGPIIDYPVLDSLSQPGISTNSEAGIRPTSLRFSSITELLRCKSRDPR